MGPPIHLLPTPAGLALATVAIALGAPLFSDGLRALRLRRALARLAPAPLRPESDGLCHVRGRVALESPLFAPLSGRPCAGFVLEVGSPAHAMRRRIEERRAFRLVDGAVSARVPADFGRWECAVSETRQVAGGEAVSTHLERLLGGSPEVEWLRRTGSALELTERALFAGAGCHVVGVARSAATVAYAIELERTGTDDVVEFAAGAAPGEEPSIAFTKGDAFDFLLVSDGEPDSAQLRVSALRTVGVVLGPLLSLTGIFYLAAVADAMRAMGRM